MVRHTGLNKDRRALRIDARGEPIDEQFADEFLDATGVGIVRRQRMPVGDEKETRTVPAGLSSSRAPPTNCRGAISRLVACR